MPVVLTAVLLPVLVYCVVRVLTPERARGATHHRRDIDVWHVLLGLAMVAGLLALPPPAATFVLAVSVIGVAWGILSLERRIGRSAHARLAVGAAAMAVMALPVAGPAQAEPAHAGQAMAGMSGMTGMAGAGSPGPGVWAPLVVALLVALAVAGASAAVVAARRRAPVVRRLDACCDLVMAGVMAVMLVGLL